MSDKKQERPWVIDYPQLKVIDLSDPELLKDLIRKGVAIKIHSGDVIFTRNIELVAGGAK